MRAAAKDAQPITGRGIGYKLFTASLIPSMAVNEMQRVYRLLKLAREQGDIPWEWIVDETRDLERCSIVLPTSRSLISASVRSAARADPIRPTTPVAMMTRATTRMMLFPP
jgi:hypothetical protein